MTEFNEKIKMALSFTLIAALAFTFYLKEEISVFYDSLHLLMLGYGLTY